MALCFLHRTGAPQSLPWQPANEVSAGADDKGSRLRVNVNNTGRLGAWKWALEDSLLNEMLVFKLVSEQPNGEAHSLVEESASPERLMNVWVSSSNELA